MKLALFITAYLFLVGCSQDHNNASAAHLDESSLQKLSTQYCKTGERLTEVEVSAQHVTFEYFGSLGPVMVFMNGSGACALERDIDDSWVTGWFTVHHGSNCLPNGSFWKISEQDHDGGVQSYNLKSIEPENLPPVYVGGPPKMDATYARDHAGLRVLKCLAL